MYLDTGNVGEASVLAENVKYVEKYAYSIGCKVYIALNDDELDRAYFEDEEIPAFAGVAVFIRFTLAYRYSIKHFVIHD